MCKIMQNIANHVLFTKEQHMRCFNDFLKTNFEAGRRSVFSVRLATVKSRFEVVFYIPVVRNRKAALLKKGLNGKSAERNATNRIFAARFHVEIRNSVVGSSSRSRPNATRTTRTTTACRSSATRTCSPCTACCGSTRRRLETTSPAAGQCRHQGPPVLRNVVGLRIWRTSANRRNPANRRLTPNSQPYDASQYRLQGPVALRFRTFHWM